MTDIPIIFSATMVLALLGGRKTMTRRLAWRKRTHFQNPLDDDYRVKRPSPWQRTQPGDRLWVREAFCFPNGTKTAWHRADSPWADDDRVKWRPSIHMPRRVSRLTLTVTAVKIERLQAISEHDAYAEGVHGYRQKEGRAAFEAIWQDLHGAGAWDANPEVVALSFTVEQRNIDTASPTPT
jgi:hypothetical protein